MNENKKNKVIEINNNELMVYTPYNIGFVEELKATIANRKWNAEKKCWIVGIENEPIIRKLLKNWFGWDDTCKQVKIKIRAKEEICSENINFNGVCVAYSPKRDRAYMANGTVISGKLAGAGSVKYPKAVIAEGTVIELTVPSSLMNDDVYFEIIDTNNAINKSSLMKIAWRIARALAIELVISVKNCLSAAMKIAWQEVRG